jgi:hypothetical protein
MLVICKGLTFKMKIWILTEISGFTKVRMKKKSFKILSPAIILFTFLLSSAFSQINLEWAKYYQSGGTPSDEEAISLCSDNGMNVYVAGSGSGNVYKIFMYSPDGNFVWD